MADSTPNANAAPIASTPPAAPASFSTTITASIATEPTTPPGPNGTASTTRTATADKVEALHTKHFAGSKLGFDTELWNLVRRFTDDVKALVHEAEQSVAAKL